MGFDNLITIGIIIYIIYSVKKTFSSVKKGNTGQSVKKTGWAGKLGDLINEVKLEIEKANQQPTGENSAASDANDNSLWDGLREPSRKETDIESKTKSQTLIYEPKKSSEPPSIEKEIPELPEENHRNYHGSHDDPMALPVRRNKQTRCFHMKKSELKKAVIWSEILSKPVGLRD